MSTDEKTVVGEFRVFQTEEEFAAFELGLEWGRKLGLSQGWDDGYREGDLVEVETDRPALTVRQKLAAKDSPGVYSVVVYFRGDAGEWHRHGTWEDHAACRADAEKHALDALRDDRIDEWKAEVTDFTPDDDEDVDAIEDLRGAFADGYTSEDADRVLSALSAWTGLDLVVEWDYVDFCTGGDSDIKVRQGGSLFGCPVAIHDFLFGEEDAPEDVSDLRGLSPEGEPKPCPSVTVTHRNLAWRRA